MKLTPLSIGCSTTDAPPDAPSEQGQVRKDFSKINEGDVVILPAFGASIDEMSLLTEKDVQIVDTTCPWVSKVWNSVDYHQKHGLTSIIHGKYAHEETVATTSMCEDYLCVKNMDEAGERVGGAWGVID